MKVRFAIVLALVTLLLMTIPTLAQDTQPTSTPEGHAGHHPAAETVSAQDHAIHGSVWVADEEGNSITVIDASTNQVLTTLTGVEGPHNLQVSPDGRSVWAVSGHTSTALAIDAQTYALLGTVPTGAHPAHIILTPDGKAAYVTNADDNTVSVLDTATFQATATIPVGEYPHGLRPSPDGRWVYVANAKSTTLSVIDTSTDTKVADVEVGQQPVQVAFSPDGNVVYASLNGDNAVAKVDVNTRMLVGKVDVGIGPIQVFVTPDNRYLLVANQGTEGSPSTAVSIVDTATFSVVNTVETGSGAHGVVIEPSGRYAYITNLYGNSAAVLDLTTQEVIATVPTGTAPNGISFSPLAAAPAPSAEIALAVAQDDVASDHEAHHPQAEATSTPASETATDSNSEQMSEMGSGDANMQSMMQMMSSMMDQMQSMDMPQDLAGMMDQMRSMMSDMMSSEEMSAAMQDMRTLIDQMLSMTMPDMLRQHLESMRSMMDMMSMMGGGSTKSMGGMNMSGDQATPSPAPDNMAQMSSMDTSSGHSMEAISSAGVSPAAQNIGGQPLNYTLDNEVKVFEITAEPVLWKILDDVTVTAWTYNGTVPGPLIHVTEGDRVRINFTNNLTEATTIHWHGIDVPNAMDGVPGVTQEAVQPGETFTYEFTANPAGTYWYHSHVDADKQIGLGLYAPFIIDPRQPSEPAPDMDQTLILSEWRVVDGQTYPSMPMAGLEPNYFTINGKAFPETETINVQVGQRVRLRLTNAGQFVHPMHLHGMHFQVVATDGFPLPVDQQLTKDTISVAPGERYDIEFTATAPGQWLFHCHITHHTTNDGVDPGGLIMVINVTE